jgi:hypothetical protein
MVVSRQGAWEAVLRGAASTRGAGGPYDGNVAGSGRCKDKNMIRAQLLSGHGT